MTCCAETLTTGYDEVGLGDRGRDGQREEGRGRDKEKVTDVL